MSKKELCPWITLNGEEIADSEFVVQTLIKHFNLSIDDHLTKERKAVLDCARIMLEEQTFW